MALPYKPVGYVLTLVLMSSFLNGCVALALVPTALNLAAESYSVHTTGQTLTENLKDAINDSKSDTDAPAEKVEVASNKYPGLPPRKPTPPEKSPELLLITMPPATVGGF